MVDTKVIAPYAINSYVWQLLKANVGLSESDFGGKVPIVPSGQDADLTQYTKPFLVYGYAEDTTSGLYVARGGSLSYAVYSTSGGEVTTILSTIRAAMERRDESARTVNDYTSTLPVFDGIRFGSIHVSYFEGPSPEESEGGRKAGVITLRYDYFADYPVKIFRNGSWS